MTDYCLGGWIIYLEKKYDQDKQVSIKSGTRKEERLPINIICGEYGVVIILCMIIQWQTDFYLINMNNCVKEVPKQNYI